MSEAKAALANVTAMRDDFIKDRDDFKEHFQKWKSLYGGACDRLRRAENLVQQAQGELNSRIDQLSIVAFGLPGLTRSCRRRWRSPCRTRRRHDLWKRPPFPTTLDELETTPSRP